MRVLTCEQLSDEWFAERRGVPTASNFKKIVTSKGEKSKQREAYMHKLAGAKVSGVDEEHFTSRAIEQGIAREDESRWIYAMKKGVVVDQVGLVLNDHGRWGASPDGLVGDNGLVEFKNPICETAVRYIMNDKLPPIYFQQVQGQIFVIERDWCDFVSHYPGLPMFIIKVRPDEKFIRKLEKELVEFCDELDEVVAFLQRKKEKQIEQFSNNRKFDV
ncbi:MAG: YqaJ viral recombinase family protein [Kiritimatiellae bacterium]|nr:YqaJ viral recombinase family protein [Kiritimatiellia bacterium]